MRCYPALVRELRCEEGEALSAWIDCPPGAIPAAGQFVMGWAPANHNAPLATPLFPAQVSQDGFLAAAPIPEGWAPGSPLELSEPRGRGFQLPSYTHRLAAAALGENADRLLPLVLQAVQADIAVALFSLSYPKNIPAAVEIFPLNELSGALAWADSLFLDIPIAQLSRLRGLLHLNAEDKLPFPAQALISTPMPCTGLAECGACAVPARRRWKLACLHGPVFDLHDLDW